MYPCSVASASTDGCPDEDVIVGFISDALEPPTKAAVEVHLDRCGACRQVVSDLVRVYAESARSLYRGNTLDGTTPPARDTPPGSAPRPGTSVGRYRSLEIVGMGGMGIVYSAYDPQLDRRIALKLLRGGGGTEPENVDGARLLREARALARFTHPNVIAVHDAGTWNGQVFVAMEFVEGWTLRGWLERSDRSWDTVRPVLLAAGRGLAAAHSAGFVHRDFKPDNVLIGADGRVCVTDFGLARWTRESTDETDVAVAWPTHEADSPPSASSPPAVPLTKTGAFVGTPAYMAPEQFARERVDASSDQFSFCVVVYEAVFGTRPFHARTLGALATRVLDAEPPEFPSSPPVPRPVRAALHRGLARDRRRRFPTMDDLLTVFEPPRGLRRRSLFVAGVPISLLGVGLWAAAEREPQLPGCDGPSATALQWNDDRRAAIRSAFAEVELPYAEATGARVLEQLDGYADAWTEAQRASCTSARSGAVSPTVAARRDACLAERRTFFGEVSRGLAQVSDEQVAQVDRVVASIPPLDDCLDPQRLMAHKAPPPPLRLQGAVAEIRDQLVRADAQLALGRYQTALDSADAQRPRAEALEFRPLMAELEHLRGRILLRLGRVAQSLDSLQRAELLGTSSRHRKVVAKSLILQVYILGHWQRQHHVARRVGRRAAAESEAAGLSDAERATLYVNLATTAGDEGEVAEAEALALQALALLDRRRDPLPWADATLNLVGFRRRRGSPDGSLPLLWEAIEVYQDELGTAHPTLASAHRQLAVTLKYLQRFDEARHALQTSLSIIADSVGPQHYMYGGTLSSLSGVEGAAEHYEAALAYAEQSSTALAAAGMSTRIPDSQRAEWLIALGRPDEARPIVDAVLAAEIEVQGEDSPALSWVYFVLASLESARRDVDATRRFADRAVRLGSVGAEPDVVLELQLDRAYYLGQAGAPDEALVALRALWRDHQDRRNSAPSARVARELGELLWFEPGHRDEARALVAEARRRFDTLQLSESAAEAAAWLTHHTGSH